MRRAMLPILTALLPATFAAPLITTSTTSATSHPLPVILWHGLGDKYDNEGLQSVVTFLQNVHPGTKVHVVSFGESGSDDQKATFLGNVTEQVASTCETLTSDPDFTNLEGGRVDALGFSQGGVFLRGLVQTCPGITVRSLVTFGSPHNGISDLPACGEWDFVCKGAMGLARANRWGGWAQANVVPAQYFREVNWTTGLGSDEYLERSGWLADVNNERKLKDKAYKERLADLEHLALYLFDEDTTVLPKETAWFADKNFDADEVVWLKDRTLYKEDWLGLKQLDEMKRISFRTVKHAGHMQLDEKVLAEAFNDFFGPETSALSLAWWSAYRSRTWQTALLAGSSWFRRA